MGNRVWSIWDKRVSLLSILSQKINLLSFIKWWFPLPFKTFNQLIKWRGDKRRSGLVYWVPFPHLWRLPINLPSLNSSSTFSKSWRWPFLWHLISGWTPWASFVCHSVTESLFSNYRNLPRAFEASCRCDPSPVIRSQISHLRSFNTWCSHEKNSHWQRFGDPSCRYSCNMHREFTNRFRMGRSVWLRSYLPREGERVFSW